MPEIVREPYGVVVPIPDGMDMEEARRRVFEKYPETDDEVFARVSDFSQDTEVSLEDYKRYEKVKGEQSMIDIDTLTAAAGMAVGELAAGAKAGARLAAQGELGTIGRSAAEGFVRGSQDLSNIAYRIYGRVANKIGDLAKGEENNERNRYERFLTFRELMRQRERARTGDKNLFIESGVDPELAEAFSYFLDPTVAVPGAGLSTKAVTRGAGKATRAAGRVTRKAGEAAATFVREVGEDITRRATDLFPSIDPATFSAGARMGAAAIAGTVGALPLAPVAFAPGRTADLVAGTGRFVEEIGEQMLERPSQLGVFERIAGNQALPTATRALAKTAQTLGGDTIAPALATVGRGAAEGAAIGGALSLAAEGDLSGAGAGIVGGSVGSVAGAAIGRVTGMTRREAQAGDRARYVRALSQRPEATARAAARAAAQAKADGGVGPAAARAQVLSQIAPEQARIAKSLQDMSAGTPSQKHLVQQFADADLIYGGIAQIVPMGATEYRALTGDQGVGTSAVWISKPDRATYGDRPIVAVNMDAGALNTQGARGIGARLFHEIGHAIYHSPDVDKATIGAEIRRLYGEDGVREMFGRYVRTSLEARRFQEATGGRPMPAAKAQALREKIRAAITDADIEAERSAMQQRAPDIDIDEIWSETFMDRTVGENLVRLRKAPGLLDAGIDSIRSAVLQAKGNVLRAMGVDVGPFGEVPRNIFNTPLKSDKAFVKMLRSFQADAYQHRQRLIQRRTSEARDKGPALPPKDWAEHPAAGWQASTKGEGWQENDFFYKDPQGRVIGRPGEEIDAIYHARAEAVQEIMGDAAGTKTTVFALPDELINQASFSDTARQVMREMNRHFADRNPGSFRVWYQAVGTSRGRERNWKRNARRNLGDLRVKERHVLPFGFEVTSEGNVLVKVLDVEEMFAKAARWFGGGNRFEAVTGLWGGDVTRFRSDLQTFMDNHREGRPGADGIGEQKARAIRTFLEVPSGMNRLDGWTPSDARGNLIRGLRVDRMQSMRPDLEGADMFFDYYKTKEGASPRFSPDTTEGYTHRRQTSSLSKGHVMLFASPGSKMRNDHYGPHVWALRDKLPPVSDDVVRFAMEHYDVSKEEAGALVNPPRIVDSAGAWDDPQFVSDLYQELEPVGFRTPDGAVVLDREAVRMDYGIDPDGDNPDFVPGERGMRFSPDIAPVPTAPPAPNAAKKNPDGIVYMPSVETIVKAGLADKIHGLFKSGSLAKKEAGERPIKAYRFIPREILRKGPKASIQFVREFAARNLEFLLDEMEKHGWNDRAKLWYDGANRIAQAWAKRYGSDVPTMAGALAVLSPQRQWFMNVSQAERVLDIMSAPRKEMTWKPEMIGVLKARDVFSRVYNLLPGMSLSDAIKVAEEFKDWSIVGAWIRAFDEAFNDKFFKILTPEGDLGGLFLQANGTPTPNQWGAFSEIGKAARLFHEGGTPELLSEALGYAHKVRSFWNNIARPKSDGGEVTIDTHSIAASLMIPAVGSSTEVSHSMGGGPSSVQLGSSVQGLYGVYGDAHRDVGASKGYLAREVQSITWEAIRLFWRAKSKKELEFAIRLWETYGNGERTHEETLKELYQRHGGQLKEPDWLRGSNGRPAHPARAATYTGKLSRP